MAIRCSHLHERHDHIVKHGDAHIDLPQISRASFWEPENSRALTAIEIGSMPLGRPARFYRDKAADGPAMPGLEKSVSLTCVIDPEGNVVGSMPMFAADGELLRLCHALVLPWFTLFTAHTRTREGTSRSRRQISFS
jgi:hypothetical protein